jgi:Cu-processing system ATP-binding protein
MISIRELSKSYKKQPALKNVSLEIDKPGIYSVLGPNGSGKTTLIKSLLKIVHKDSGLITINGADIDKNGNYRKSLTYQPQIARFPENLTLEQIIRMLEDIRGEKGNYEHLIQLFELDAHRKKSIKSLSGGSRQKLNILLSLMFDSQLMIFDEPTTGLDPLSVVKFKEILREQKSVGKYILMTSHVINFVEEMSDYIIFLLEGEIRFFGTVAEINERTGCSSLENSLAAILGGKA